MINQIKKKRERERFYEILSAIQHIHREHAQFKDNKHFLGQHAREDHTVRSAGQTTNRAQSGSDISRKIKTRKMGNVIYDHSDFEVGHRVRG